MEDLKLMTVRALRELAKQHLGAGHSKLKTKAELITALSKKMAADMKAAAAKVSRAETKATPRAAPPKAEPKPEPRKAEARPETKAETPRAEARKAQPKPVVEPRPEPKAEPQRPSTRETPQVEARRPATAETPRAEPKKFEPKPAPKPEVEQPPTVAVKKVEPKHPAVEPGPAVKPSKPGGKPVDLAALRMGATEPELEPEPSELTPEPPPAAEAKPAPKAEPPPRKKSQAELDLERENLGELPWGYGDDAVVLAARDPHTLWAYWDIDDQKALRARSQLRNPRAVLRLLDGGHLVREVDVAIEARSWYIHNVIPGRRYRAELVFVGERGEAQRVGPTTPAAAVPAEGPSPIVEDRFVTLPWEVPLAKSTELVEPTHPAHLPHGPRPHAGNLPFSEQAREALMARAEAGLRHEVQTDGAPGFVEFTVQVIRGLGGSETLVENQRRRERLGRATSSRSLGQWSSGQ